MRRMEAAGARIELSPRCSLTAAQARLFFAGVCTGCLGFAGFLALKGFWPVLPFAGLEMAVLGLALKLSLDRRHQLQTILITDNEVRIECRPKRGSQMQVVFPRHWAQVKLLPSYASTHPSRLVIESSGRACEVGQFLTEGERRGVARQLGRLIGRTGMSPPLGSA
jgi:uncharacterized membrane protein